MSDADNSQPVEAGEERAVLEEAAVLCFEMSQKYPLETMGALQKVAGIIRTRLRQGSLKVALEYVNSITPSAVVLDDERAAFERHWYDFYHSGSIKARSDGRYMQPVVQHAWEAWQARAASPQATATQAPFANCQFKLCDLPGQCRSEGKCHHPHAESPQPQAQTERALTEPAYSWLPISSAPRDGSNILIRFGRDGVSQAKYVPGVPHPWKFIDTNDGITWLINGARDGEYGPSHWMPMPSPHEPEPDYVTAAHPETGEAKSQ